MRQRTYLTLSSGEPQTPSVYTYRKSAGIQCSTQALLEEEAWHVGRTPWMELTESDQDSRDLNGQSWTPVLPVYRLSQNENCQRCQALRWLSKTRKSGNYSVPMLANGVAASSKAHLFLPVIQSSLGECFLRRMCIWVHEDLHTPESRPGFPLHSPKASSWLCISDLGQHHTLRLIFQL